MTDPEPMKVVCFTYTNHRGETATRRVEPIRICYEANEWHVTPQWMLYAFDHDRRATRCFAMMGIRDWVPLIVPATPIETLK